MDGESKTNLQKNTDIIFGHTICQTTNAKWLCLDNIFQKFLRPNIYDIGGTYIQDVADYWFTYKTEQVGSIFLLHMFISNWHEGSFSVAVSYTNKLNIDKKNKAVYLPTSLKTFKFEKQPENSQCYINTYVFSDLDVASLEDKKLYIAVSFSTENEKALNLDVINNIKANHDFGALLTDPIGSDFQIESADGDKFQVHKVLLAAHSEVFKAMLKEETAETQSSYVKLDTNTEDLRCMLEFIYTGTIKDVVNCNFFNLLMIADLYNLTGLRDLCQHAICQQLTIENALEALVVADTYNSEILKLAVMKFIKKHPSVLRTSTFKEINNAELIRELCNYIAHI